MKWLRNKIPILVNFYSLEDQKNYELILIEGDGQQSGDNFLTLEEELLEKAPILDRTDPARKRSSSNFVSTVPTQKTR